MRLAVELEERDEDGRFDAAVDQRHDVAARRQHCEPLPNGVEGEPQLIRRDAGPRRGSAGPRRRGPRDPLTPAPSNHEPSVPSGVSARLRA